MGTTHVTPPASPAFEAAPDATRTGEASRAAWIGLGAVGLLAGLVFWAYDALPLNRVQSQADTRNPASARVLEKLGFVHEGTLRQDCIVDGVVSDSWVYGLLRSDWDPTTG